MGRNRSRSRSRERGSRGVRSDRESGRGRDDEKGGRKRSRSPSRRHFREDNVRNDHKDSKDAMDKSKNSRKDDASSKPTREELRRMEAAAKRKKIQEEEQRKKDKVKDRMDLIRQMKGDASGEEDALDDGDDDGDEHGDLTEEQQMMRLMGFTGFESTKGKEVEDNKRGPAKGGFSKHKEREYRQYMNRRGGFNRPLDKI